MLKYFTNQLVRLDILMKVISICSLTRNFNAGEAIRPITACAIIANICLFGHALSFLKAEFQARKQHIPFLKSLVHDLIGV